MADCGGSQFFPKAASGEMEVRRRSAMRDLSPKADPGHDLPVAGCLPTGGFMRIADI